jgi:DNA-binding NtrC family response regulator
MQHSADSPLFTTRIAVVAGDRSNAEMLHMFFRLMDFEIALAEPDCSAVDTIRGVAPAVVLIDLDLPNLRALELASEIRSACEGIAIIFMTSGDGSSAPPDAIVVPKPARRFEEMLSLFEVVLEQC